jgi:tRNA uridine 5-carboxymethylaminomethyl modification enzyme
MLNLLGRRLESEQSLSALLKRPEVTLKHLRILVPEAESGSFDDPQVAEQVEIQAKYEGYIERQRLEVARTSTQDNQPIPRISTSPPAIQTPRGAP